MKANLLEASNNMQATIENLMVCLDTTEGLETMVVSNLIYSANRIKNQIDQVVLNLKRGQG